MSIPAPPVLRVRLTSKERAAAIRRFEEQRKHEPESGHYRSAMHWSTGPRIVSAFPLIIR